MKKSSTSPLNNPDSVREVLAWMRENWPKDSQGFPAFSQRLRSWCRSNLHPRHPVARRLAIIGEWAKVTARGIHYERTNLEQMITENLPDEKPEFIRRVLKEEKLPPTVEDLDREMRRMLSVFMCHIGWLGVSEIVTQVLTEVAATAGFMEKINERVEKAMDALEAGDDVDFDSLAKFMNAYAKVMREQRLLTVPLTVLMNPDSARNVTLSPKYRDGFLKFDDTVDTIDRQIAPIRTRL